MKEPISETLMDNVPIDTLPQGIYTFYLLAAPEGMINTYYMWKTEVIIGPPDGAKLYAQNCASCHGPLASTTKKGRTAPQIQTAIDSNTGGMGGLKSLTPAQVAAIAGVLPAPATTLDGTVLYAENCASCHGPLA